MSDPYPSFDSPLDSPTPPPPAFSRRPEFPPCGQPPRPFAASSFLRSLGFALDGLRLLLRTQPNARRHLAAGILVIVFAALLPLSTVEWAVLLLTIAFVFVVEMLNTVVETAVDLASPDRHPLAKAAKDLAAGAVLVAALFAATIGLLILGPHLLRATF